MYTSEKKHKTPERKGGLTLTVNVTVKYPFFHAFPYGFLIINIDLALHLCQMYI